MKHTRTTDAVARPIERIRVRYLLAVASSFTSLTSLSTFHNLDPVLAMRIPSSRLAALLTPSVSYDLRTADFRGADPAIPYTHALALCYRGEVEGVATAAGRIRYLRLLPESERTPVLTPASSSGQPSFGDSPKRPGHIQSALVTYYEEVVGELRVGTLCKARNGRMVRWDDKDGFNPVRWNPDAPPPALYPHTHAAVAAGVIAVAG